MLDRRTLRFAARTAVAGLIGAVLTSCVAALRPTNGAVRISLGERIQLAPDHALVLVGIAPGDWIAFDKYDPKTKQADATCGGRFDQIKASSAGPTKEHAVFDVVAGYYAFSDYSGMRTVDGPGSAYFSAVPGTVNYVGDFRKVERRGDLDTFVSSKDSESAKALFRTFGEQQLPWHEVAWHPIPPEYLVLCAP